MAACFERRNSISYRVPFNRANPNITSSATRANNNQLCVSSTTIKTLITGYNQMIQSLFGFQAMTLLQEMYNNVGWKLNPIKMYQSIYTKKHDARHIFMKKHNLELNNSEFIAILLWSSSSRLTRQYHIDCENNNEYKWKLFIKALTTGIKKICNAVIIDNATNESENVFPSLPNELYRGTTYFKPNGSKWNIDTILSFTTSLSVAESFAARNVQEKQDKSSILCIQNFSECLLNGKLIVAPIQWLSSYDYEQEWITLPSAVFTVQKADIRGKNFYQLTHV